MKGIGRWIQDGRSKEHWRTKDGRYEARRKGADVVIFSRQTGREAARGANLFNATAILRQQLEGANGNPLPQASAPAAPAVAPEAASPPAAELAAEKEKIVVRENVTVTAQERDVLRQCAQAADDAGFFRVGLVDLARLSGVPLSTVHGCMKRFRARGWLDVAERSKPNSAAQHAFLCDPAELFAGLGIKLPPRAAALAPAVETHVEVKLEDVPHVAPPAVHAEEIAATAAVALAERDAGPNQAAIMGAKALLRLKEFDARLEKVRGEAMAHTDHATASAREHATDLYMELKAEVSELRDKVTAHMARRESYEGLRREVDALVEFIEGTFQVHIRKG